MIYFPFINLVLATAAGFAVGAIWYSPVLFGSVWMKLVRLSKSDIKASKDSLSKTYFSAFVASFISSIVLWYLLLRTGAGSVPSALRLTIILWVGFIGAKGLDAVFWERKPLKLYFINSLGSLAQMLAVALVISLF